MLKNNLSKIMGEKRINMKELETLSNIGYNNIFNLYHNKTKMIKFETIEKLCKVLDISVGDLFEYIPD